MEECQAWAFSTDSHSEGLLHPPFLVSRPPSQLWDVSVPVPGPVLVLSLLSLHKNHPFHPHHRLIIIHIISAGGLKICLSDQINVDILEHSSEEVTIREYVSRALAI